MNSGFRKLIAVSLMVQVLYLIQIYPYLHLRAHMGNEGLHSSGVTHAVLDRTESENLPTTHSHTHYLVHDLCYESNSHFVTTASGHGTGEGSTTPYEQCTIDPSSHIEADHLFDSSFLRRSQPVTVAIPSSTLLLDNGPEFDETTLTVEWLPAERVPPDDIIVTLCAPRPPPPQA